MVADEKGKDPKRAQQVVTEVLELLSSGKVVPALYDPIYDGLDEVAKGLDDLDNRRTWGRAVVRVRKDDSKPQARL